MKYSRPNLAFLLGAAMLSYFTMQAQVFQRLHEDNALPTNFCNDIAQDTIGMIWIATESGLVRFDGQKSKIYYAEETDSASISSNSIQTLYKGSSGILWAIADDGYLNRYDYLEDNFRRFYLMEIDSVPDRRIWGMFEQDTILWLAAEIGLLKFNTKTGKTRVINPRLRVRESNHGFLQTVYAVHIDKRNPDWLWLGTRAGLVLYKLDEDRMEFHTSYIPAIPDKGQYAIQMIHQENDGKLWLSGSWIGLYSYHPDTGSWSYFFDGYYPESAEHNAIKQILPKSDSEFWVASFDHGFGTFNRKTKDYTYFTHHADNPYSIQKAPVQEMIRDSKGNIWMCGPEGISFFNPEYQQIHVIELPERRVTHPLAEIRMKAFEKISNEEVLVGSTSGDGIYITNLQSGKSEVVEDFLGKDFNSILTQQSLFNHTDLQTYDFLRVSEEMIWVAMDTQFAYFNIPARKLVFPESTNDRFFQNVMITSLQIGPRGKMWGLNRYKGAIFQSDPKTGKLISKIDFSVLLPDALGEERAYGVRDFFIDQNGLLWYHTYSRVLTYDLTSKKVTLLPTKKVDGEGTSGTDFYNITGTGTGEILLSCQENGLQIIRPAAVSHQDSFELIGLQDGLPIEKIVRVQAVGNDAWLATRKGLVRYNLPTGDVRVFDRASGLPDTDLLNYWTTSLDISEDGKLFVGHANEFSWLDTKHLFTDSTPFNILFTNIEVHGREKKLDRNILLSSRINLDATETFFTLHFAPDDFTRPDQQQFKYRLAGYDSEWVDAGNSRSATYTKVPGGSYTFEVLGANSSGVWMHEPARMEIHVDTPFFQSNLFYFLILLVALALVYFAYRYRMKQVREREKLKAEFSVQLAEVEMTALRAQMNPHFVFNSLNSINKYILTNEPRIASRYLTKFSQLMRLILNNSKSKTITLEDEINALSLYVEMEQLRFEHKFEFEKNINTKFSPASIMIPPMLIQPYIENAIWHGLMPLEKPGLLRLEITQHENQLICVIEDNGIGRKKAMEIRQRKGVRKKSMGMQITSDRIALVEALHNIRTKIDIEDKYDQDGNPKGTKVTLTLPIENKVVTEIVKTDE